MDKFSQESDLITNSELETLMDDLHSSMPPDLLFIAAEGTTDAQPGDTTVPDSTCIDCNYYPDGVVENTSDVAIMQSDFVPNVHRVDSPTGLMPSTRDYSGPYNFHMNITGQTKRHAWSFSDRLNKVFIDMNKVLLIQFKLSTNNGENPSGLKVRALLMYSSPDHMRKPVQKCMLHWTFSDPKHQAHMSEECLCDNYKHVGHVLTTDSNDACYEYDKFSKRHSVTVPISPIQPAYEGTNIAYQFGCKTSCQGGMGRRPTYLIFTLENSRGEVIGRHCVSVKVCSCPERDKRREESDIAKENKNDLPIPQTQKCPLKRQRSLAPPTNENNVFESSEAQVFDHNEVVNPFGLAGKKIKIDPHLVYVPLIQENEEQQQIQLPQNINQPSPFNCQNNTNDESQVFHDSALVTIPENVQNLTDQVNQMAGNVNNLFDQVTQMAESVKNQSDQVTQMMRNVKTQSDQVTQMARHVKNQYDQILGFTKMITGIVSMITPNRRC